MKQLLIIMLTIFYSVAYTQNIGIGMPVPTAKLHINGTVKLEGTNLFEFGSGVAGKEVNAGKVGYNAFGTAALAFVGAGTSTLDRSVYFFAERGTTFTGPINVGGTIMLNGNAGTAGQVLTSNGATDPAWKDAPLANNTRFAFLLTKNAASANGDAAISTTLYNLNTTNVVIGSSGITINKTGLYHFDLSMSSSISYTAAPTVYPQHELWFYFGLPNSLIVIDKQMIPYANTNTSWIGAEKVSLDVHVTAPANLHFYHALGQLGAGTVTGYGVSGFVAGYLISD